MEEKVLPGDQKVYAFPPGTYYFNPSSTREDAATQDQVWWQWNYLHRVCPRSGAMLPFLQARQILVLGMVLRGSLESGRSRKREKCV